MSAPKDHTAVILMLSAATSRDPITAPAKMDLLEMEKATALVLTKASILDFGSFRYINT